MTVPKARVIDATKGHRLHGLMPNNRASAAKPAKPTSNAARTSGMLPLPAVGAASLEFGRSMVFNLMAFRSTTPASGLVDVRSHGKVLNRGSRRGNVNSPNQADPHADRPVTSFNRGPSGPDRERTYSAIDLRRSRVQ